mgnify:CR=1 FL=1
MLAVAGMLFAACSSDKDVAEGPQNLDLNGKTEGYFKINLNLPTAPMVSMRAWGESNTTLSDGLPVEYGINSLILLLFDGASESAATLKQVINLTNAQAAITDDNPNQITTKGEYVAKLKTAPTGKLFAMAVVNGTGNIEMVNETSISLRGTTTSSCTISDLQDALASSSSVKSNGFVYTSGGTNYFFMTNAVLSNEQGGTVAPTTAAGNMHILAPVDAKFIYETEDDATAGTAATDIYVERGVAKVTIASASLGTDALTDNTTKLSASLDGWCLDNTNKSSYVVRQVPTANIWNLTSKATLSGDKYRFVGGNSVDAVYGSTAAGYRTYWAADPNYESDYDAANFSTATYDADKVTTIGSNTPLYCLENTFDVAHQTYQNTTRAIVGVKLTSDDSEFYVMGADRKTLYTEADVKDQIVTDLLTSSIFLSWWDTYGTGTLAGSEVGVTWSSSGAGVITVTKITIPKANIDASSEMSGSDLVIDASSTNIDGKDLSAVVSTINGKLSNVERFEGGIAYYAIRIQHFGDALTPWNNGEFMTGYAPAESTIAKIYPDATDGRQTANYLGRYGMVRNNWYELEIGDILKVGSSTVPTLTNHPDDDLDDLYIKARINILSWAKRTQSWNLK